RREAARLLRHARAARDVPRHPGNAAPAAGPGDAPARRLPRRCVDGHRLARDDGGCGAQRANRRARSARESRETRGARRVTTIEAVTPVQEALDRACAHLLSLQHADGWWKGEL